MIWDDSQVDPEMLVTVSLILRIKLITHDHSSTMRCFLYLNQVSPAGFFLELNLRSDRIDMARQSLLPKLFKLGTSLVEYRWISNVSANYKTKPQNHTDSHCWFNHVKHIRNGCFLKWGTPQNHPNSSISVLKPMVTWGSTFWNPPIKSSLLMHLTSKSRVGPAPHWPPPWLVPAHGPFRPQAQGRRRRLHGGSLGNGMNGEVKFGLEN